MCVCECLAYMCVGVHQCVRQCGVGGCAARAAAVVCVSLCVRVNIIIYIIHNLRSNLKRINSINRDLLRKEDRSAERKNGIKGPCCLEKEMSQLRLDQ